MFATRASITPAPEPWYCIRPEALDERVTHEHSRRRPADVGTSTSTHARTNTRAKIRSVSRPARVCSQRVQASLPHQNPGIASGQRRSMSVSRDTSTHVAEPQTPAPPHSHTHAQTREQRFDLSAGRRIRNAQMLTSKSFAKDTMRIS